MTQTTASIASDRLSVGYAWTKAERDQWFSHSSNKSNLDPNDYGYTVWEFNIYGDPKYGLAKPTASADATPSESEPPPTTLEVEIPDYVVSERAGLDFVEIPGGKMWYEEGQLWLPYYTAEIDIPPGYEPQDVGLTDRSGLMTDTGLELPVNPEQFTLNLSEYLPNPGTQEWFPEVTYDWRAVENADGSVRPLGRSTGCLTTVHRIARLAICGLAALLTGDPHAKLRQFSANVLLCNRVHNRGCVRRG